MSLRLKRLEWVRQSGAKDCGVSCLLMIIRYYGGNVPREYLREMTHTSKEGVSAYDLIETASKLGFDAKGLKGDVSLLKQRDLPIIAHVVLEKNYQHFVVITKLDFKKQKITILDPARGTRNIHRKDFEKITTNHFLYLKPNKPLPNIRTKKFLTKMISSLLKTYPYHFIVIFITSLLYIVVNLTLSFLLKFFLDYMVQNASFENGKILFLGFLGMIFFRQCSLLLRQLCYLIVEREFERQLVKNTLEQMIFLPYLYYKNRTTGEMVSRFSDLESICRFCGKVFFFVTDVLFFIVLSIFLFRLEPKLFCLFHVVSFATFLFLFFTNYPFKKHLERTKESSIKMNSQLVETLQAVDCFKGLHLEQETSSQLEDTFFFFQQRKWKMAKFYTLLLLGKDLLTQLGNLVFFFLGSSLIIESKVSLSTFVVYQNFLSQYTEGIEKGIELWLDYRETKVALERVQDLYDIKREDFRYERVKEKTSNLETIQIRNLTYGYRPDYPLLKELSLSIKQGEKVLLYGKSGSGKSTLAKLLMRYYEVPLNRVFLKGEDIHRYHLSYLRDHMTYVSQNEFLFTDSIYHNIVLHREIPYAKFLKIAKLTLVNELIQDEVLGYDRLLEENGFNLSGGERQRIVLARSLLKESDVYIFDESFNQIDIEKERTILKNIFSFYQDKTILVVSHRYENEDLFDRKLKLEEGMINESEGNLD